MKFQPNGHVRIEVWAEVFGRSWAVTESVEGDSDVPEYCISGVESGKRIPRPWVYENVEKARSFATFLADRFPGGPPEDIAQLRAECIAYRQREMESNQTEVL